MADETESGRGLGAELVAALQRARSRLAVAIAAESKATPTERRRYYRDTEERMRGCLRSLRSRSGPDDGPEEGWTEALEALRRLPEPSGRLPPRSDDASRICRQVSSALAALGFPEDSERECVGQD